MKTEELKDIFISKKKIYYPVNKELEQYLVKYDRKYKCSLNYSDLLNYTDAFPVYDSNGKDTLWLSVIYDPFSMQEIHRDLISIYSRLKSDGSKDYSHNLLIDSIDFCSFGNSNPFRIKIKNHYNDNHDYFYIKKADASRVFGLELEHILSPNYINFLTYKDTLIEEHIIGIPGDIFIESYINNKLDKIRFAKEFVKFNERCFMRLLADQRSYNFVVVLTPDFDKMQYRIRSIDFDQQSYEGNINLYKPQFFKENYTFVKMVMEELNNKSIKQYQTEERALLAKRMIVEKNRLEDLITVMKNHRIAPIEKVMQLRQEIYNQVKDNNFKNCTTMGEIVKTGLDFILRNYNNIN